MKPLITFEGLDGAGKTTQIKMLNERIGRHFPHVTVLNVRHPGGTPMTEEWRLQIKGQSHYKENVPPMAEFFLLMANHEVHYNNVIVPALEIGNIVISDRFIVDTSHAYQCIGRGLPVSRILGLIQDRLSHRQMLTFYMRLPAKHIIKRMADRGGPEKDDKLENAALDFHPKVAEGYDGLARSVPNRVVVINALDDINDNHEKIWNAFLLKMMSDPYTSALLNLNPEGEI